MSKRSIRRIVTEIIVIGILIFLIVFCVGFRVTKVEVKGNQFYSDEEIKKMVLDVPAAKNTLLAERFINTEEKTKEPETQHPTEEKTTPEATEGTTQNNTKATIKKIQ